MGIGVREFGWIQSSAVSYSALFAAQLMISTFAGFLVSRVTSIDAEGMMMSVLLVHLRVPYSIYISKIILHFVLTTVLGFIATILLAVVMNISSIMVLFSLISLILVNLVSSLGYITASAMFPRFDWEDESRIGTSEKASLVESFILRAYEIANVTVTGTSGALLYGKRIGESVFFAASFTGVLLTSLIWCGTMVLLLIKPWWKEWRL
jgi:hypothetical protein